MGIRDFFFLLWLFCSIYYFLLSNIFSNQEFAETHSTENLADLRYLKLLGRSKNAMLERNEEEVINSNNCISFNILK